MYEWILGGLYTGGIILVILSIIFSVATVIAYILTSIGLARVTRKRNLPYPWMAWIPVIRYYLLGLLINKELAITPQFRIPLIQFILPLAGIVLIFGGGQFLATLFFIIALVLIIMAFVSLFRQYQEPNAIIYGILAGLPLAQIIGCFLIYQLGMKDPPDTSVNTTIFS
jgi:hypothetical protein